MDPRHVVPVGPVGGNIPDDRLPGVSVGVDKARHQDVAAEVDHLSVCHSQVLADGDDAAFLDQNLAVSQIADGGVEGKDGRRSKKGALLQSQDPEVLCNGSLRDRPGLNSLHGRHQFMVDPIESELLDDPATKHHQHPIANGELVELVGDHQHG